MSIIPEVTTPAMLAKDIGWPEQRVRKLAKRLGTGRVLGNRMIFLNEDVSEIKAAIGTLKLREAQHKLHLDRPSFVYFVASREFIKIGWSENWRSRFANMQTSNPDPIKVLLVLKRPKSFEAELHEKYAAHLHRGEWFRSHPEIKAFIKDNKFQCCAGRKR